MFSLITEVLLLQDHTGPLQSISPNWHSFWNQAWHNLPILSSTVLLARHSEMYFLLSSWYNTIVMFTRNHNFTCWKTACRWGTDHSFLYASHNCRVPGVPFLSVCYQTWAHGCCCCFCLCSLTGARAILAVWATGPASFSEFPHDPYCFWCSIWKPNERLHQSSRSAGERQHWHWSARLALYNWTAFTHICYYQLICS